METVSGGTTSVQVRVVPMVPGMRTRKRQCSSNNNSTAAENDNDSILSSCDGCSFTDNDSMRPVADFSRRHSRSNKRRRTILDAFNSISLKGVGVTGSTNEVSTHMNSANDTISFSGDKSGIDQSAKCFNAMIQNPRRLGYGSKSEITQPPTIQQYTDDADSSRAVAEDSDDYGGYTTNSSLEEEDEFEDDDDDEEVDEQMLSDKELLRRNTERKV
jgi:hypothetical protein